MVFEIEAAFFKTVALTKAVRLFHFVTRLLQIPSQIYTDHKLVLYNGLMYMNLYLQFNLKKYLHISIKTLEMNKHKKIAGGSNDCWGK